MQQPKLKAIVFFLGVLGVGYAIGIPVMTGIMGVSFSPISIANLSAFAFLFAILLTVWLDKPFELELFKWPEKKPEKTPPPAQPAQPPEAAPPPAQPEAGPEAAPEEKSKVPFGALFPHERPSEHWTADFADNKQVYEGSDLPIWILAGWAIFIIWAVVYLVSGLPGAF